MRRERVWMLAVLLALCLCACAGKAPFDPEETTGALLAQPGVFSEELERLEDPVTLKLYGLEEDKVEALAGYGSTGATAEEAAVFRFVDEASAQAAMEQVQAHWEYMKESNVDYRPQEMPKLEKAVMERRGNTVLYLVAADYEAAQKVLP